jgi:hypothetical protein
MHAYLYTICTWNNVDGLNFKACFWYMCWTHIQHARVHNNFLVSTHSIHIFTHAYIHTFHTHAHKYALCHALANGSVFSAEIISIYKRCIAHNNLWIGFCETHVCVFLDHIFAPKMMCLWWMTWWINQVSMYTMLCDVCVCVDFFAYCVQ